MSAVEPCLFLESESVFSGDGVFSGSASCSTPCPAPDSASSVVLTLHRMNGLPGSILIICEKNEIMVYIQPRSILVHMYIQYKLRV